MAKVIRTGLIRCDSHGLWFGPLMMAHDPLLLQRPMDPSLPRAHSWQGGASHRYFYSHSAQPLRMTAPFVDGFEIVKLWDADPAMAQMASRVFKDRPEVCEHAHEVSDGVDLVLIADCDGDGSDHLSLAEAGLRKGVATFIDKPLADNLANAQTIVALAAQHGAPLLSMSMLRTDPTLARLRDRMRHLWPVNLLTISGCGLANAGLVHSITAAQQLAGSDVVSVCAMAQAGQTVIHLDYASQAGKQSRPLHGVVIHCQAGRRAGSPMAISLQSKEQDIHERHLGDRAFVDAAAQVLVMIRDMVHTGRPPAGALEEMLSAMAVIDAVHRSLKTHRAVNVQPMTMDP